MPWLSPWSLRSTKFNLPTSSLWCQVIPGGPLPRSFEFFDQSSNAGLRERMSFQKAASVFILSISALLAVVELYAIASKQLVVWEVDVVE